MDLFKLLERKKKAESLPKEELEKHLEDYLDICAEIIAEKRTKFDVDLMLAEMFLKGLFPMYGRNDKRIENYCYLAIIERNFNKLIAVVDYYDKEWREK